MARKKHNYRDSLFVDIFGKCDKAKENFLSLYNAIHDTVIVLAEQQSTINYNMPLRCLEYVTAQYSKMFKKERKYAMKRIELPRPEFYALAA